MKFQVSREGLLRGLATSMRAVSLKSTLPILANVCLSTEGSKVKLSTTNLELGVNYWVNAEIENEGSLSVPARVFLEFINSLVSETVGISAKEEVLYLTSDSGEANISGIASAEFPPVPLLSGEPTIFLDPKEFQKAVAQVAFAASADTGRMILNGILTQFASDGLTLVSTDGYRLATKKWKLEGLANESVIIPSRSMFEISRIVAESAVEGEELKVDISKEKNQLLFGLEKAQMATRLLDGTYPNYQQIIPQTYQSRTVVETTELVRAIRTVSVFAKELGSVIKLQLTAGNELILSASTNQLGGSSTSLKASIEGEEVVAAFNQKFLSEALAAISTSQVSLELASATHPMVLRGVGDESYLHLIMPVRMQL